jgi:hypothetical protein|tara:strand:- start:640 stop:1374 length:735 start_codon:yes stop_codon:yes gene_type:complete
MKKIKITLLVTLLFTSFVYSQSSTSTNVSDNNTQTLLSITGGPNGSSGSRSYGTPMRFVNPPRTVDGSIYLFEDWKNYPVIIKSKDNKTFTLNNVNFNLRTNRLVTKISQDSIFVLNMKQIDNINILGKVFKKIDSEIGSRVFEVIYESDKVSILNFHSVKLVEGSVNPMLSRKNDKLIHKEVYYLLNDSGITEFRLKKKFILESFANNEAEKKSLLKYYSQNKLSFKNLNDLKNVLNNIDNIL